MAEVSTVYTTRLDSPIGTLGLASTELGLAYVALPHASGRGLEGHLAQWFEGSQRLADVAPNQRAAEQILAFLEGELRAFDLALDLRGTAFQCEVWQALREIPFGETRSYAQVAREVRRPSALRAVGAANGANPVSLVVPCHRVVASDGSLGGYGGGRELKARLLAMERSHSGGTDRLL